MNVVKTMRLKMYNISVWKSIETYTNFLEISITDGIISSTNREFRYST